jgi:nicotinamide mononucleotide adenylyltransferase
MKSLISIANKFEKKINAQAQVSGPEINQMLTNLTEKLNKIIGVNQWVRQLSSLQDLQALQNMINSNELKTKEDVDRYMAMLDKDIKIINELPKYL